MSNCESKPKTKIEMKKRMGVVPAGFFSTPGMGDNLGVKVSCGR
jgi:hypothetical protein